eukprot:352794-Chlamydomonas_euryale.AAC.1
MALVFHSGAFSGQRDVWVGEWVGEVNQGRIPSRNLPAKESSQQGAWAQGQTFTKKLPATHTRAPHRRAAPHLGARPRARAPRGPPWGPPTGATGPWGWRPAACAAAGP